jgi:hypothetical protein
MQEVKEHLKKYWYWYLLLLLVSLLVIFRNDLKKWYDKETAKKADEKAGEVTSPADKGSTTIEEIDLYTDSPSDISGDFKPVNIENTRNVLSQNFR